MHAVIDRDAATGHEQVVELARQERAVRDPVERAVLRPVAGERDRVGRAPVHVVAPEHAPADEAPALGDAELLRHAAQVRAREAGLLAPQPLELRHHALAALELGVGEVLGQRGVDAARDLLGRAPRQEQPARAGRAEADAARRGGRGVLDAAEHEPEPGQHVLALERAARRREQVAVAGGVDHGASRAPRSGRPSTGRSPPARRPPSTIGSAACAWSSRRAPASSSSSSSTRRIASGS